MYNQGELLQNKLGGVLLRMPCLSKNYLKNKQKFINRSTSSGPPKIEENLGSKLPFPYYAGNAGTKFK